MLLIFYYIEAGKESLQSESRNLKFMWEKISDNESGIQETHWCAGSRAQKCDIVSWKIVDHELKEVLYTLSNPLPSGSLVFITLKSKNGAGMTSSITSPAIKIDSSPPVPGRVTVGNSLEMFYLRDEESLIADWNGFSDKESGIHHYEWAICLRTWPENCVTQYTEIGTKTSLESKPVGLKPGKTYVLTIRAYNNINLHTQALSNPFILDDSAPLAGAVFDGTAYDRDITIQSSTSEISANWDPFRDPQGRLVEYSMCVGSAASECDVSPFVSVGHDVTGTISGNKSSA